MYRHYKGSLYNVLNHATLEKTGEDVVVYQSMETGKVWVRPLSEWDEEVLDSNGNVVKRFTEVLEPCNGDCLNCHK